MTNSSINNFSSINITKINLWAHVGVLESEIVKGQLFLLDIIIWLDLRESSASDDLSSSLDYVKVIKKLQELSSQIRCKTIEHFSESILDALTNLYGPVPVKINLTKVSPPITGFTGQVSITKTRNLT